MKKLFVLSGLTFATVFHSGVLMSSTVEAQSPASCNWFTGIYRGGGAPKGVIAYIGNNELVVYNGNPTPLRGSCIANDRIQVTFGKDKTYVGIRSENDVAWTNGTTWRRESSTVAFPLQGVGF